MEVIESLSRNADISLCHYSPAPVTEKRKELKILLPTLVLVSSLADDFEKNDDIDPRQSWRARRKRPSNTHLFETWLTEGVQARQNLRNRERIMT